MKGKSIRGFILAVAIALVPICGQAAQDDSQALAASLGETHSAAYGAARALATTSANLGEVDDARDMVIDMLRDYVRGANGIRSAWTVWEPDSFDNNDAEYVNAPYHDATGRFVPRVATGTKGIVVQATEGYAQPGSAYSQAMAGGDFISEPYYIGRQPVYTICVPVLRNGARVGAVGIEVDLSPWLEALQAENGALFMISPGGVIGADGRSTAGMLPTSAEQELSRLLRNGGSLNLQLDTGDGESVLNASAVDMGGGYWAFGSLIPADMQGGVSSLIYLGIGLVLFAVGLGFGLLARPRKEAESLADALDKSADGDPEIEPPKYSGGNRYLQGAYMSFGRNVRLQQQHRHHARSLAAGKYLRMYPVSDKDDTTTALNRTAGRMEGMARRVGQLQGELEHKQAEWSHEHQDMLHRIEGVDEQLEQLSTEMGQGQQAMVKAARRIAQASSQIAEARRQAEELSPAIDELNGRMEAAEQRNESIRTALKALEEISVNSRIISLNAKVEAAHTERPVFNALAQEMSEMAKRCAQLHQQTAELLEKQPEDEVADASAMLGRLMERLDGAGQSLEEIPAYDGDGTTQTLRQVREALQGLNRRNRENISTLPTAKEDNQWWGKVSHFV